MRHIYWTARFRVENWLRDLRDRHVRGRCTHAPLGLPTSPGYHFWRCGLAKGHDGPHRSGFYDWIEDPNGVGASTYNPHEAAAGVLERKPVRTRRQRRASDEYDRHHGRLRVGLILLLALLSGFSFVTADAQADWPYSTNQVSYQLYSSKVDGRCGSGSDVVCIRYKDAGYTFGPQWDSSPNCWAVDYNGDGKLRYGEHSYIMFCRWGERFVYLVDTRSCYGLYRVNSHTPDQVAEVIDGRSCSGDWTGGP